MVVPIKKERNNTFSDEQFAKAWYRFRYEIPNLSSLHYLFSNIPPINDNREIVLEVPSTIKKSVEEQIVKLQNYLGDALQNDSLKIVVMDAKIDPSLPVTPKEKARYMYNKNKNLSTLFTILSLQLN